MKSISIIAIVFGLFFSSNTCPMDFPWTGFEEDPELVRAIQDSCIEQAEAYYKGLSKAELHIHLGGAWPLDFLRSIATTDQRAQLDSLHAAIKGDGTGTDYKKVFEFFPLVGALVNTNEKVENGTIALMRSMEADGVTYAQIRTGLKRIGSAGFETYLDSVLYGIQKGTTDKIKAVLVLSLKRSSTLEDARATVDLAIANMSRGVVGIDISDNSTTGDISVILPELKRAKEAGLFIAAHIGESLDETDQMLILNELQPERVGHGVHLKPEALAWIKEHKTPVEMCLSSAVLCRMIQAYGDHPALALAREIHPVVVCTDDPLLFATTLSREFALAEVYGRISRSDLDAIALNAFCYANSKPILPSPPRRVLTDSELDDLELRADVLAHLAGFDSI